MVQGSGFMVKDSGFMVKDSGFMVKDFKMEEGNIMEYKISLIQCE